MKTLFIPLVTTWPHNFAADLELIEQHAQQGKEVEVLVCNSELKACDINYLHDRVQCDHCIALRKKGFRLLGSAVKTRSLSDLPGWSSPINIDELDKFKTISELSQWSTPTFDIGMALTSSLISVTRDPSPDISKYRSILNSLADASLRIHLTLQQFLSTEEIETVYVLNGRFATLRAVIRACESNNTPYYTHESGRDSKHYAVYPNTIPHSIANFEENARNAWDQAEPETREQIARDWYQQRSAGTLQVPTNFTKDQTSGLLPSDWHSVTKRRIAVFPSSEDEFVAIGKEWSNPLFSSQNEGLRLIIDAIRRDQLPIHLFIRCHPNLKTAHPRQFRELQAIQGEGVTIIDPEDKISTYDLMKQADCTLSFGSTAGIEAAYWGQPSVLAGRSFYANLGATYNPTSLAELVSLLQDDIEPKPDLGALIYAHALATHGVPFKFFEPVSNGHGKYRGRDMHAGLFDYLRERDLLPIARRFARVIYQGVTRSDPRLVKRIED
ncbi:hypothetical protein [Bremerella sp. P1]|uniref:hypothetical protein n=1 Tax=Bremerella sp. P1 TaxID=3026424 RepID=UPI002367A7E7|nr:hypothetical protein [Bremerella sp. P1]WDI43868.1 hypothetical protein PSR63_07885 [Bremerella sp. P1]